MEQPTTREELFDAGLTAQMKGDLDQAVSFFRETIQQHPQYPPAYLQLGRSELRRGNTREALRALQAGLKQSRRSVTLMVELGVLLQALGDAERAERLLTVALRANRKNVRALQGLSALYVGRQAWGPAVATLQELLELSPNNFAGHFLLAQVHEALANTADAHRSWMTAESICRERLSVAEDQPAALFYLGEILRMTRDWAAARDSYESAADLAPAAEGFLLGLGLMVPWASVIRAAATACSETGDVERARAWQARLEPHKARTDKESGDATGRGGVEALGL